MNNQPTQLTREQLRRDCLTRQGWKDLDGSESDLWGYSPDKCWEKAPDPTTDIAAAMVLVHLVLSSTFEKRRAFESELRRIAVEEMEANEQITHSFTDLLFWLRDCLPLSFSRAFYFAVSGQQIELLENS